MGRHPSHSHGFTLIELSIVLVIIGLIAGGVLVGQELIRASQVRATISQVEKFNTAANTFRGKYGYLPGDIKDPDASSFGFMARGGLRGQGDGNGILECNGGTTAVGTRQNVGETAMFWVDLSTARLIDGTYNTASSTVAPSQNITTTTTPSIDAYLPQAKLGGGNYFYVYSNGTMQSSWQSGGINYFGLSAVAQIYSFGLMINNPTLTVNQAYAIDKKMDDGLPFTGNVIAQYVPTANDAVSWADGGTTSGSPISPSSNDCYDNGGVLGGVYTYTLSVANGANALCALSFQFQ